jgi:hypothetical protein
MAQVIEHLPSKALSSNTSTAKNRCEYVWICECMGVCENV